MKYEVVSLSKDSPYWDIVQDAYSVFHCDIPTDLEACNFCCMVDALQNELKTYQSRDIPLPLLREWGSAAVADPISKPVWMYFLPRILEVLASGHDYLVCGLEISLRRYATGKRENWTDAQWAVLDAFQKLYLRDRHENARSEMTKHALDDKVCMFALAGWDVDVLMREIIQWPAEEFVGYLHHDWIESKYQNCIWTSEFWENLIKPDEALKLWTQQAIYDRLEAIALDNEIPKELSGKALELTELVWTYQ